MKTNIHHSDNGLEFLPFHVGYNLAITHLSFLNILNDQKVCRIFKLMQCSFYFFYVVFSTLSLPCDLLNIMLTYPTEGNHTEFSGICTTLQTD